MPSRSHPPTLLRLTERTLREECQLGPDEKWLIAVSGGPDSTALLHVLHCLSPKLNLKLVAHGVNHGLRREATQELELAGELSARLGVPFAHTNVSLDDRGNLQARARAARLKALERVADANGCNRIATAHHADDRAETVIIRILGGAVGQALGVLPPTDGARIRPFARARRTDVLRHLNRHGIGYSADPSNRDPRFLRARVRHDVLPLLEELSPSIVEHLNALADEAGLEPLPPLADETGKPLALRRAHVREIRKALAVGRHTSLIRLPGKRQIHIDPRTATLTVIQDDMPGRSRG